MLECTLTRLTVTDQTEHNLGTALDLAIALRMHRMRMQHPQIRPSARMMLMNEPSRVRGDGRGGVT